MVAGPDAYRDLPRLLAVTHYGNQRAINVILSLEVKHTRNYKYQIEGYLNLEISVKGPLINEVKQIKAKYDPLHRTRMVPFY